MRTGKFISYRNTKLFYRAGGQGKTVILLHGFGEDGEIWNDLSDLLQSNFQTIIPDIPGSGKSGILKENEQTSSGKKQQQEGADVSIDDYADAIKYIMDAESIETCSTIGHSMGGYISLAFAEKYPERLNSLGLFHSSAFADDEEKIKTRLKAINSIKDNGAHNYLKTFLPGLFTENFNKEHSDIVENLIKDGISFTEDTLIQYHKAMVRRPDRSNVLKQFLKPVLFIAGEKDKAIPLNSSLMQSHMPSICHFHILPNAAHMGMLEEKNKSENIVLNFLINL